MATQQWIPPLPLGYEARWDPNQRAYFFVNHNTKTTSWQDPRYLSKPVQDLKLHQQPQAQHQQLQSQHQQSQSQHQQATTKGEVKVDMTKVQEIKFKFHSVPNEVIKKYLKEANNSVDKTLNKLHDLGYRCHNDENKVHENFESLGFKPEAIVTAKVPSSAVSQKGSSTCASQKGSSTSASQKGTSANGNQRGSVTVGSQKSSSTTVSQKGTSANVDQLKSSSAASSAAKSVTSIAAPVKPQLSEEHKQSMTKKFQDMFKSCDKSVIEMALQVCDYDESRVKNVLERMNTVTESHPVATTIGPSDSHAQSLSPVQNFDAASLEPIKLFDDEPRPRANNSVDKTLNKLHDLGYRCHNDGNKVRENVESLGFKPEATVTAKVPSSAVSQKGSSTCASQKSSSTSASQKGTSANGNQRGSVTVGSQKSSSTTVSQKGTSANVDQLKSSSAASSAAKSVTSIAAPVKPQLSEEHKQSMTKKFQDMFKSCDKSVIEMALQVCDYDESRVKNVLERMNTVTESHPVATTIGPSDSHVQSLSQVQNFDAASLEPIKLFDDEPRPRANNSVDKTLNKLHDLGYRCHNDGNKVRENVESLGFKPEATVTAKVPSSAVSQKGSSTCASQKSSSTSASQKGTSANGNQRGSVTVGSQKSSSTTVSQKGTSANVDQLKSSSAASSAAKSVTSIAAPVKPQLSEEHKQSMTKKFQDMFKSCDKSVIEMALQVCDYDESRVKNVLERVNTVTESHPVATTIGSSDSHAQSLSSVQNFDAASLEPIKLFDDEPRPRSSSSSKKSTPVRVKSAVKKGSDLSSRPSTGKSTTTIPQKSAATILATSQSYHPRARQVTHPGQNQTQNVISRQPERSGHLSKNRTQAKGPDPSLCVGPNNYILLSKYIMAKGPNLEMCQSHDPSRAKGSQGAVGPNKALHYGPQSNLVQGPIRENHLVTAVQTEVQTCKS